MTNTATTHLRSLETFKEQFGEDKARGKLDLLEVLDAARFVRSSELFRYHEILCFMRAYPDSPEVLQKVEVSLCNFESRSDLKTFKEDLVDSGIAGTRIDYSFYWVTADWLANNWPEAVVINWGEPFDGGDKIHTLLKSLLPYAEIILLDETWHSPREWLEQVKGPNETDAAFLIRRFQELDCPHSMRETIYEDLDIPMSIMPGPDTPSRTRTRFQQAPLVWQTEARSNKRPALRREMRRQPEKVARVSPTEGQHLIDIARRSMVTRGREVDAFANASPDDVTLINFERGLQLACMGAMPARRHILEAVYIFLLIKNGVPIGYTQAAVLFGSAEVNFNMFDTFRGGEAGWLYGQALSAIHHMLRSDCIVLDPYQVGGGGNLEGLKSGAWWFYYKMGFRSRDTEMRQLGLQEARKAKKFRGYRTPISRLRELAEIEMYFYLGRQRSDVLSVVPLENIGGHVTHMLATRFGGERKRGIRRCVREATELLGMTSLRDLNRDERQAWERWSPLVMVLPGVERWSKRDKVALVSVITAKGGRRETDYLHKFDQHPRLREALLELAHSAIDA